MGKGEGFSEISAGEPPQPRTILQIFQDAAKLFWWSRKPMLCITLFLLLPNALVFLESNLVVTPLITDMAMKGLTMRTKDPSSPEYHQLLMDAMKDLRELTGVEVGVMLFSFFSSCFLLMAVVSTVAMAWKGEQATVRGLLCRIRSSWKGPVVTQLCVVFLYFGYTVIFFLLFGVLAFVSNGSMAALGVLGSVVAILSILLLVYLELVWHQAVVISVVEEGCYGLAALARASELLRGRRKLGFSIYLLLLLITFIFSLANYFLNTLLPPGQKTHLVGGLLAIYPGLVISVFGLTVKVVFYYECKRSHGEEVAMKGSLVYTRVPTAPILDEALP